MRQSPKLLAHTCQSIANGFTKQARQVDVAPNEVPSDWCLWDSYATMNLTATWPETIRLIVGNVED